MIVKPKSGLKVFCPERGDYLPDDRVDVPDNTFWRRRLRDGDVELIVETQEPEKSIDEPVENEPQVEEPPLKGKKALNQKGENNE